MLKIIVNDYLKNGKVVYENENHNKMIIFGNKNGEEFKIKIRYAGYEIAPLYFKIPYDANGVNYQIKDIESRFKSVRENKELMSFLQECTAIIERWIIIEIDMYQLCTSNLQRLFSVIGERNENSVQNCIMDILNEMDQFEEMKEIVNLYQIASKIKS